MSKNVIPYFVSFFFSGIVMFCFFALEYPILYLLWSVGVLFGGAGWIGLAKYAKKNQLLKEKTSILWVFNEEINNRFTNALIALKSVVLLLFALMCLIPIKRLVIDKLSLCVLIVLIVLVIEKCMSACYEFDEMDRVKYSSWESCMTGSELVQIYRSRTAFFTMGILPLIVCLFYGNPILRGIFAFFAFMLPMVLGHLYPALMHKKK